jgi:hypothetical protein
MENSKEKLAYVERTPGPGEIDEYVLFQLLQAAKVFENFYATIEEEKKDDDQEKIEIICEK